MPPENIIDIFFRFYSDILDEETTETLKAEVVDEEMGYYKIKSIPFYIPQIAAGDTVWADYSEAESKITYRKTIQHSGNTTVNVIMIDNDYETDAACEIFQETGCRVRKYNEKYFAINILAAIDYTIIKNRLEDLQKQGSINYIESCLSEKHRSDFVFK